MAKRHAFVFSEEIGCLSRLPLAIEAVRGGEGPVLQAVVGLFLPIITVFINISLAKEAPPMPGMVSLEV